MGLLLPSSVCSRIWELSLKATRCASWAGESYSFHRSTVWCGNNGWRNAVWLKCCICHWAILNSSDFLKSIFLHSHFPLFELLSWCTSLILQKPCSSSSSVTSYSSKTAVLTLEHNYPQGNGLKALVDIELVLGTIQSYESRVGEWVNVMGYVGAPKQTPSIRSTGDEIEVSIQAILLWSAGPLKLDRYEEQLDRRKEWKDGGWMDWNNGPWMAEALKYQPKIPSRSQTVSPILEHATIEAGGKEVLWKDRWNSSSETWQLRLEWLHYYLTKVDSVRPLYFPARGFWVDEPDSSCAPEDRISARISNKVLHCEFWWVLPFNK